MLFELGSRSLLWHVNHTLVLHLFIHLPKHRKLFFCITPCAEPMVCVHMESHRKTVLPDHLTTYNQLHVVPPARDGAGNSSGLNKICSVLPTFAKEGHHMALSVSGFPGLRPLHHQQFSVLGFSSHGNLMAQNGGWSHSYYIQHSRQSDRKGLEDKANSSCPSSFSSF